MLFLILLKEHVITPTISSSHPSSISTSESKTKETETDQSPQSSNSISLKPPTKLPSPPPSQLSDPSIVALRKDQDLFFGAIDFVCQMKTGSFHEHSAYLSGISKVPNWRKVNDGLFRMYENEVLMKFPVAQHIYFGTIIQFSPCTTPRGRGEPMFTPFTPSGARPRPQPSRHSGPSLGRLARPAPRV